MPLQAEEQEELHAPGEDHPISFNFTLMTVRDCRLPPLLFWWPVCHSLDWWYCFIFGASLGGLKGVKMNRDILKCSFGAGAACRIRS